MSNESQHDPQPVSSSQRYRSLDVLRGFALLGILGPNILYFAWPSAVSHDPHLFTETLSHTLPQATPNTGANVLGFDIMVLFFFGKMMFLFSLLFGAGVVMYAKKFEGQRLTDGWMLWYSRMGWLLLIGLMHGIFLWFGDILVSYAVCGLGALWWVRNWTPKVQLIVGSAVYLFGTVLMTGLMVLWLASMGGESTGTDPLAAALVAEINAYTGTYLDAFKNRGIMLLQMYVFALPLGIFWMVSGIMISGMALTRLGVLTGERSTRFYAMLAAIGIPLGLGVTAAAHFGLKSSSIENAGLLYQGFGQLLGIPTALGYAGLVILIVKLDVLRPLTSALAAVGRMALSNYLLQTILCTTIFYSHGFGYFWQVQYPNLWLVMVGVWLINIVFSVLWFRVFRFGPTEWAWRSLTYWQLQPMLRPNTSTISTT